MKKKKWLLIPSTVAVLALVATTAFANSAIKIVVDGKLQTLSTQANVVNNHVVAPVRDLAEALGAKVSWDSHSNTVTIQSAPTSAMKMQIDQLQRAIAPQTAQEAVEDWAKGCQTRNGALQYAVMSPDLQAQNYDSFAQMNWVTGVSSPWIQNYKVIQSTQVNDTEWQFQVQFEDRTSTGITGIDTMLVTIDQINKNWYLSGIKAGSSYVSLLKQTATLPDGTPVNEGTVTYNNLDMVSTRVFSADVTSQSNQPILSPANFYGGGTIVEQENVTLPAGQATLALVQSNTDDSAAKPTLMYYLTILRDYPNRDDMKLVYTIMARPTGDQTAAKEDLLKIAQSWKLPQ